MKYASKVKFSKYLEVLINQSPFKQNEIADKIGYVNPNIITLFKKGRTRVPIYKVPMLAKVFGVDPGFMLRRYLAEYETKLLDAIEPHLGVVITENERVMLGELRRLTNNNDPKMSLVKSEKTGCLIVEFKFDR
ncbi:MAG: hypothetical protein KGZ69_09185 [Methylomonas sp.]|nr:hypothetical protein [Methylomonas sp.]